MGFLMDGLDAEGYDRQYTDKELVTRIVRYFKPVFGIMSFVAVMILLNAIMNVLLPILLARGIDNLAQQKAIADAANPINLWQSASLLLVAILLSGILAWVFNFFRQWFTARSVGDIVLQLRKDAFDAVLKRDMSFYDEYASGKIVSRVTSDTQSFATVVTLVLNLMSEFVLVIILVGVLFFINVKLALITLIIAPFIVIVALAFRKIARETTLQARRVLAEVNSNVQESVAGIAVAKAFRQEVNIYEGFTDVNKQSYRLNLKQGYVFSGIFPILGTVAGIGTVLIVYFGGQEVQASNITAGEWFLFVEAINAFWFPLTSIASFWSQFQLGLSASERVFSLVDAQPRVTQLDDQDIGTVQGKIEFKDLDFRYTSQEQVLEKFNLTIEAGETVAFVGHTGAGKSSLGKLVARFYEFQSGYIYIDDKDLRYYDLANYRKQIGIVQQTPFLFGGTVRDNIRYTKPDASDEEVIAAAERIGGGDWLEGLQDGLDTNVGEEGKGISLGQRQLVALARVLLKEPSIVILDEATASIDPLTEAQIQEGLDTVLESRTAIVIAHRLSTIKAADRIIVLANGEIVEEGNHDALMAQDGHYAELYNTYYRHQALDYEVAA